MHTYQIRIHSTVGRWKDVRAWTDIVWLGWVGVLALIGSLALVCAGWMKLCNYCPKLVRIASKYLISKKRDTIYCLEFVSINLIVCFRRRYRERELAALD